MTKFDLICKERLRLITYSKHYKVYKTEYWDLVFNIEKFLKNYNEHIYDIDEFLVFKKYTVSNYDMSILLLIYLRHKYLKL